MPRQRNWLTTRPSTVGQWLCMAASYVPPGLALAIQLGVMYPYLKVFCYDYLVGLQHATSVALSFVVLATVLFGLLLTSFFKAMFTSPGYVDGRVWRTRPHYVAPAVETPDDTPTGRYLAMRHSLDNDPTLDEEVRKAMSSARAEEMTHHIAADMAAQQSTTARTGGGVVAVFVPPLHAAASAAHADSGTTSPMPLSSTAVPPPPIATTVTRRTVAAFATGGHTTGGVDGATGSGHGDAAPSPSLLCTPRASRSTRHSVSSLTVKGQLRYCYVCDLYKPDDAHHCGDCNRCVRRMDHHCPWINNCVGADNLKFFLLFLIYIPVCATYIIATIWYGTTRVGDTTTTDVTNNPLLFTKLAVIVLAAGTIGVVLGGFACLTCYFTVADETTLQRLVAAAAPLAARRRGNSAVSPDSTPESANLTGGHGATSRRRGCLANCRRNMSRERILSAWRRFLGPDWRLWAIPVVSARPFGEQEGELAV